MNLVRFQQELALIPVVSSMGSLPDELREAAVGSVELQRLVDQRIRCDRLLEEAPCIEPPLRFAEGILERVLAEELPTRRPVSRKAGRRHWLRSPLSLVAAAVVLTGFALVYFRSEGPEPSRGRPDPVDRIDPELLASLDLLLDWEALEEHQAELDLLVCSELAGAVDEFGEEADQLR